MKLQTLYRNRKNDKLLRIVEIYNSKGYGTQVQVKYEKSGSIHWYNGFDFARLFKEVEPVSNYKVRKYRNLKTKNICTIVDYHRGRHGLEVQIRYEKSQQRRWYLQERFNELFTEIK